MFIKQISVFAENKPGSILEITGVLKDASINIRALSIADTTDFGIVRLIVDKPNEAVAALKSHSLAVVETDVIAISVSDTPGGFHSALEALFGAAVSVEYSYAFVSPISGGATVILKCSAPELAVQSLLDKSIKILSQDEIEI